MNSNDRPEYASTATPATTSDPVRDGRAWFSAAPINVPEINSTDIHERVEVSTKPTSAAESFEVSDVNTSTVIKDIFGSAWVRYPMALLCFYFGFLTFSDAEAITNEVRIPAALTFACLGIYLAREVMLWVAGLALAGLVVWGLFAGFAALTVPAAIIVGAIIIAFAVSR